jgi:hypothetical protein
VVGLSSNEEDIFPDTSWGEEFAKRLFGEEDGREEEADVVPPSTVKSPAPTASDTDADDTTKGVPYDSKNQSHP